MPLALQRSLGWELHVDHDGELKRSQFFRDRQLEVRSQEWQDVLIEKAGRRRTNLFTGRVSDSRDIQKLAFLWKPSTVTSVTLAPSPDIQFLLGDWQADVDGDAYLDAYHFTRQPLVVNATVGTGQLQVIVMHTKSSFVNAGVQLWNNPATREQYVIEALKARRRNSAECMRTMCLTTLWRTYKESVYCSITS